MAVECKNCPLRGRDLFQGMSSEDVKRTQRFKSGELVVDPGSSILMEGSNAPQLYTALRGMGLRYNMLPDGSRQVVNLVFPGDFIGLQAGIMGEMAHSVEATTHMTLCVFNRSDFYDWFTFNPTRAFDLIWLAATEEHFLGETLATVGQRSAKSAVAWALLKIYARGEALNLIRNNAMPLPYRQQDLADLLGLSLVHTNKTLTHLRQSQLVSWNEGSLMINDRNGLAKIAMIDDTPAPKRPLI